MKRVLVVEDSKYINQTLKKVIEKELDVKCLIATSKAECEKLLSLYQNNFEVALLDLRLPDAMNGEVIDTVEKTGIPVIVLTGTQNKQNQFKEKNIVDYVIKDGAYSIFYALSLTKQLIKNKEIKVLVADDSKFVTETISALLQRYNLNVFKARDGKEALELFAQHPDIKLLFTDYEMPNMDGIELTRELRKHYKKNQLSIIVMTSSTSKEGLAAKFLKYGANDFIYKDFSKEEFYARLNSNLEILSLFEEVELESEKNREKDKLLFAQSKMLAIGDLLHNISHHWRQPLNVISNIVGSIIINKELDIQDEEKEQKGLNKIAKTTQELSKTIEDFITFFKKEEKEDETFDLTNNISNYITLIKPTFNELGITISFNPTDKITINTDRHAFNQILLNILNNSKEAFENIDMKNKKVDIDILKEGTNRILIIKDNAQGIQEDILHRVYEPYFTTKHQDYGKGMGLYMSKEIIENQLNGNIELKNVQFLPNDSSEMGTLVRITLPNQWT